MREERDNPLYDDAFRKSIIWEISYEWPLTKTQEELMSILMKEHYGNHTDAQDESSVKNDKNSINTNEYCDRCNTFRFRNKRNRLTCKCPPE